MTRYLAILAAAMMLGCSGNDKGAEDTGPGVGDDDDDDDDTNGCANTAAPEHPTQGDVDVYYRTGVRFALDTEDPAATIAVADLGGTAVAGTTTVNGTTVSWSADTYLQPSTEYAATLTFDCGEASLTFTTSDTGLETVGELEGQTYALDVANGQWLEPPAVGTIIASQLGDTQIFVSPTLVEETQITMFGAIGSGNAQDECSPTIPFPAADFTDPYFELQSPLLPLVVAGFVVEIEELDMSGAFSPDTSRIQGASLAGAVDTRPLGEVFDLGDDEGAVCEFVATFGVACETCESDGGVFCLSLLVENIAAPVVPGLTLVAVSPDDVANNPNCQ